MSYKKMMFVFFHLRVLKTNKRYGAGMQYVQGQLDEAYQQLSLHENKITWE